MVVVLVIGGGDPGGRDNDALSPWHFSTTEPPPFSVVELCQGEAAVADVDFLSPRSTMATETADYALSPSPRPSTDHPPTIPTPPNPLHLRP